MKKYFKIVNYNPIIKDRYLKDTPVKIVIEYNECPIDGNTCEYSDYFIGEEGIILKCTCADRNKETCRFYNYGIYKID